MNKTFNSIIFTLILIINSFIQVISHGMVLDPVARGSRWRSNSSAPHNYNDSELYCGGMSVQWNQNKGKCGICGDNYADARPRKHEIGGEFGEPVIVRRYPSGSLMPVKVRITANHKGKFWFELCNMDHLWEMGAKMEDEKCFNTKIFTKTGDEFWYLPPSSESKEFEIDLKVPRITCKHCIFRWTWMTGLNFYNQ